MRSISKVTYRQNKILDLLKEHQYCTVSFLSDYFNCSEATTRSDLRELEKQNLLIRTTGGARQIQETPVSPPSLSDSTLEKQRIAEFIVQEKLYPNVTLILDSGTSCEEVAKAIVKSNLSCTVITHSLENASILSNAPNVTLYVAGGKLERDAGFCNDDITIMSLGTMYADITILGVNGVSVACGLTISRTLAKQVKLTMVRHSKYTIVPAVSEKIGHDSVKVICDLGDINEIITSPSASKDAISAIQAFGVKVSIIPK